MTDDNILDITPPASGVVESLRDFGYELHTSVADLVDNSIDANATQINISLQRDYDGKCYFSIIDNLLIECSVFFL